jgi:hypothetical protein
VAGNSLGDWLMLVVTIGVSVFFFYSTFNPKWMLEHWTPARWVNARVGERGVRIFFLSVALALAALAIVEAIRFNSSRAIGYATVLDQG